MTAADRAFLRRFIASRKWQFARTMPENPHEYTVRKWKPSAFEQARFDRFVKLLVTEGWRGKFGKRWWPYIDVDGYSYWTFGSPLENTTLINRKRIEDTPGDRGHTAARVKAGELPGRQEADNHLVRRPEKVQ